VLRKRVFDQIFAMLSKVLSCS